MSDTVAVNESAIGLHLVYELIDRNINSESRAGDVVYEISCTGCGKFANW